MHNTGDGDSLAEQEVKLLFAKHLPLYPLPPSLDTHVTACVMQEVAHTLRGKFFGWSLPALPFTWPWTGVRGSRRR
ncbi:MAG TPA: hypothetical protein PKE45_17695 [Caldilineaceae bacterium]|nr:hypothetical protein [Caldilineaceae bacterium]